MTARARRRWRRAANVAIACATLAVGVPLATAWLLVKLLGDILLGIPVILSAMLLAARERRR